MEDEMEMKEKNKFEFEAGDHPFCICRIEDRRAIIVHCFVVFRDWQLECLSWV